MFPFIKEGTTVKATQTKFKTDINVAADSETTNSIYMLGAGSAPSNILGKLIEV